MNLARPQFLWLLVLVPVEILVFLLRYPGLLRSVLRLFVPRLRPSRLGTWRFSAAAAFLSSLTFIIATSLALAGPSWGTRAERVERSGLEVALVLDVSRSMEARDSGTGSRLEAAKTLIRSFMEEAAGSSFSLVVAKGEGMLLVPMTEDLDAIEATLDYADPGAMSAKGTDLGRGIQVGLDSFSGIAGPGHILVLLSDGGDQGGTVRNVAMTARNRSVRIIAIGFGGSEPVIVPGPDDRPLEEPGKGPVRVALDPVPLKTAAAVSSGRYLEAGDAGILSTLGMELAHESKGGMRTVLRVKDQAPLFALIALAALVARLLAQGLATANFGKDGKAYKRNIATEAQRHRGKKGIGIKSEEYSGHSR